MLDVNSFSERLSELAIWRKKEINDIIALRRTSDKEYLELIDRAGIVLAYAHWEGFFSDCVDTLCDFLRNSNLNYNHVHPGFMEGCLGAAFQSLQDRNHKQRARLEFLEKLEAAKSMPISTFQGESVKPQSNLDYDRLELCFDVFGIHSIKLRKERVFIQHQLTRLRHSVAHGDSPKMQQAGIEEHLNHTIFLIDEIAQYFDLLGEVFSKQKPSAL